MRAEAEYRLRCVLPDHLVYPLRSVGRHMSQQSGSGFTERPEELGQGVLVPALVSHTRRPVSWSTTPVKYRCPLLMI